jgi:hypothetical protein
MTQAISNATLRMRQSGDLVGFGQSYARETARRQLRASLALVGLFAVATLGAFAFASYETMRPNEMADRATVSAAFAGQLSPPAPVSPGVNAPERDQVLLGVTGSGKTFTMAQGHRGDAAPGLILAPNKTLAAQLYGEFKSFFPDNAVEYFVSYYDYYQPEAYVPRTDTYIEKESSINEQIDRMRHSATRSLLERDDVIIVASVSCIYGIGSVETYSAMTFSMKLGERIDQRQLIADLVALQYKRNDAGDFARGTFPRARRHDRDLPGALRGPRLAHQLCSATRSSPSPSSIR